MQELKDKLAIAYLREDEWGLTSLLDLLLRIYEAIVGGQAGQNAATQLNLQGKPHEESEQIVWELISDFLQGRSLLLIAENLDTILENIGIEGQKRLRAIIQTSPVWNILATSTSISSD